MDDQAETAERLMRDGYNALNRDQRARALKIGRRLRRLRHSSGFEIMALAYLAQDKFDKAIKVLEKGVQKAPSVWLLWQLLGNCYSDHERFGEAHVCYERALKCPGVDGDSVHLNTSIALAREGRLDDALSAVERIAGEALQPAATAQKLFLFNKLGRHAEALAAGARVQEGAWRETDASSLAGCLAELGVAHWKGRRDRDAAARHAWRAIQIEKRQETAAWLVREITDQRSKTAKYVRVIVCGRWHEPIEGENDPPGFFVNYDVVAEDEREALEFIRPFEPEPVRDSLTVDDASIREDAPDEPKGVYRVLTGYLFFPWESHESP
jgi:tetratricopeptide (TPR) repeat protein